MSKKQHSKIAIDFEKFTLDNGLQVLLHHDDTIPLVSVNVWYHVGSHNEDPGKTGFAHLFEHMMFEGSKHHHKSHFEPLQKIGASSNGSTDLDRTNYWENLPNTHLKLGLWLEADRMGFLLDALDQKKLDNQISIVKNERRQSYENRPYGESSIILQSMVYPALHPYHTPVIGFEEDLNNSTLEDVKEFFRKFYSPSNASIAIAGDFDSIKTTDLLHDLFGHLPYSEPPPPSKKQLVSLNQDIYQKHYEDVPLPRTFLAWPAIHAFHKDEPAFEILSLLLGGGKTSRLYQSLIFDKQIAQDFNVFLDSNEIAGSLVIDITARPEHSLRKIISLVIEAIEKIAVKPPSEKEILQAQMTLQNYHIKSLENVGGFNGRADQLNFYNVIGKEPNLINTDIERYLNVSPKRISDIAKTLLTTTKARLDILPKITQQNPPPTTYPTKLPNPTKSVVFKPPVPSRITLQNGIEVLFIKRDKIPLVTMSVFIKNGSTLDPENYPGLTYLTSQLLQEGTSKYSSKEIASILEGMGTNIATKTNRESITLSSQAISHIWPKVFSLLSHIIMDPAFSEDDISRVKNEHIADLYRLQNEPRWISDRIYKKQLYGKSSPYGYDLSGNVKSIPLIQQNLINSHYHKLINPSTISIVIVGDTNETEIINEANKHISNWKKEITPLTNISSNQNCETNNSKIILIDKPNSPQSMLRIGHLTVPFTHPDARTLNVINYILGGNPSSRLFLNLREDKGYSYGYYSSIEWQHTQSPFISGGSVQSESTTESILEVISEFKKIQKTSKVKKDEFQIAKDGLLRNFSSNFENQSQIVSQLQHIINFNLDTTYVSTIIDFLNNLTLNSLHDISERLINPNKLQILVIGDKSKIYNNLKEIGLPIITLDAIEDF